MRLARSVRRQKGFTASVFRERGAKRDCCARQPGSARLTTACAMFAHGRTIVEETEGDDGRLDGSLRQADQACFAAHVARYGQLSRPLYRRLMQAAELAEAGSEEEWEDE
jgi:hypothetical protein